MPLAAVRTTIRSNKKSWFETKNGPRGWIIGPVVCLWLSAFDRYGPMAIALLKSDGFETRIVGRAGADLNGMALFLLLTPLMGWITWQMHTHGQGTLQAYITIGIVFGLGLPVTLWVNSKDRRDADPLVSFLRRVTTHGGRAPQRTKDLSDERHQITVQFAGRPETLDISEKELFEELASLANGDFIVLAKEDEHYMQVASTHSHLILEKREGSPGNHFRAELPRGEADGSAEFDMSLKWAFDVLSSFAKGQRPDRDLSWKRVTV